MERPVVAGHTPNYSRATRPRPALGNAAIYIIYGLALLHLTRSWLNLVFGRLLLTPRPAYQPNGIVASILPGIVLGVVIIGVTVAGPA